jgi:hypothetical protein
MLNCDIIERVVPTKRKSQRYESKTTLYTNRNIFGFIHRQGINKKGITLKITTLAFEKP